MPMGALMVPVGAMQVTKLLRKTGSFLREFPETAGLFNHVAPFGTERNLFPDALFEALYRVARGERILVRRSSFLCACAFSPKSF